MEVVYSGYSDCNSSADFNTSSVRNPFSDANFDDDTSAQYDSDSHSDRCESFAESKHENIFYRNCFYYFIDDGLLLFRKIFLSSQIAHFSINLYTKKQIYFSIYLFFRSAFAYLAASCFFSSAIIDSNKRVVNAFGRSIGFPKALAQTMWQVNPSIRLKPNSTV